VRFELCGAIAAAEIAEGDGSQPQQVRVQLAPEASERFAELTRQNVGRPLEVTHAGHVFVRAAIQAEVTSGTLTATYARREDAEQARRTLLDASVCARGQGR
jgi:preprotein translocase subunit SecD